MSRTYTQTRKQQLTKPPQGKERIMNENTARLTIPVHLLSHTTLARIYWELEYTGYENMDGEMGKEIESASKLCKYAIEQDIGDYDVVYDFMESVRNEVIY